MTETREFTFPLWDFAPEDWVTPENRAAHEVVDARLVGERGNEEVVIEIERSHLEAVE